MTASEPAAWELVHAIHEYHDRPLRGVADYRGTPHAFARDWNAAEHDWADGFRLQPITNAQLLAVREGARIFARWLTAHQSGMLEPGDEHPALAIDRPRHEELAPIVANALAMADQGEIVALGEFRGDIVAIDGCKVRWSGIDTIAEMTA